MNIQDARDGDMIIAKAMGWTDIQPFSHQSWTGGTGYPPGYDEQSPWCVSKGKSEIPSFHSTVDASRSVLLWIAKQDEPIQVRFIEYIKEILGFGSGEIRNTDLLQMMMVLSEPENVAKAAIRLIEVKEGGKA